MIRSIRLIGFSGSLFSRKTITLLDLRSFAIKSRLQNSPSTASWKLFGPAVKLLTALTSSIASICWVSRWIRLRYRGEEISWDETARISCGCDGKRCSTVLDSRTPGSLVEKKKFSSTAGLRSTKTATMTNNTAVTPSISQCVPNQTRFFAMERNITRFDRSDQCDWPYSLPYAFFASLFPLDVGHAHEITVRCKQLQPG